MSTNAENILLPSRCLQFIHVDNTDIGLPQDLNFLKPFVHLLEFYFYRYRDSLTKTSNLHSDNRILGLSRINTCLQFLSRFKGITGPVIVALWFHCRRDTLYSKHIEISYWCH